MLAPQLILGAIAVVALALLYNDLFIVRDRGRYDPAGPVPEIKRVIAVVLIGFLGGASSLVTSIPWWGAFLYGAAAAGGLSMGHLGGAGLKYSAPAERWVWLYSGRQWLTYPMLALSGLLTTAWAAVAAGWVFWPLAIPAALGGLAKVLAYDREWKRGIAAEAPGDNLIGRAWDAGVPLRSATKAGLYATIGVVASLIGAAIVHAIRTF